MLGTLKMAPRSRRPVVAAYAALAVVAALFLGFALATLRELDYRNARQVETYQSGTWFIHQAVTRLALLEFAVTDYALLNGGADHEAVQEQLDLFWSTIPILASKQATEAFQYSHPPAEFTASLLADLERLEPLIGRLAPGDVALVREIQGRLAGMLERLLDFSMETHRGRLRNLEERGDLDGQVFWQIAASIVGMLTALAGVAVLLVRETGRTRRLLREAGSARAEATNLSRRLQTVIDAVPAMITASDTTARYLIMNRFHADFYGIDGDAAVGRSPSELGLDPAYEDEVRRVAAGGEPLPFFEQTALDRHGRAHVLLTTKVPVALPGGRVGSVVHVSLDITERRAAEERVRHMAHHDPLTDLPNRAYFLERLHEALPAAVRQGGRVAVHCVDLDRFKEVNDTLGHAVGDALLVAVAGRMRACLRQHDTLARFGGDEFAIIQEHVAGAEEAGGVAERVVETLSQPFLLEGNEVVISASVGVAVAPGDGTEADDLLRHADMALYRAKHDGRARVRFFTAEMNATLLERRALEQDLRRTLAAGGLSLHYQPKYGLRDRRLIGLEALVRWRHPELGFVPPSRFVPLAEETGLIGAVGEWVLRAACRQARAWIDAGIDTPPVAVNLSPAQFSHQNVVELVERTLRETGLPPDRLELEITESLLIRNSEQALSVIHRLRALGVQVSLDDFGTGYSALNYLQRFPFDILKIDRSFTAELGRDGASLPIVEAIVRLAHGLKMRVVAEGLETPEQVALLRGIGCDAGQGYVFAKPLPPPEVEPLLRSASAAAEAAVA